MSGGVDSSVSLALLASPHLPSTVHPDLARKLPFGFPSSSHDRPAALGQIDLDPKTDLDISAVFMRNWSPMLNEIDHPSWEIDCAWEKDWEDVQRVCRLFDVPVRLASLRLRTLTPSRLPPSNRVKSGQIDPFHPARIDLAIRANPHFLRHMTHRGTHS